DLDRPARRTARLNTRLHRAPLAVPIGLGTRVLGADPDLVSALRALADGRTPIVESSETPAPREAATHAGTDAATEPDTEARTEVPTQTATEAPTEAPIDASTGATGAEDGDEVRAARRLHDPRPALAGLIGRIATRFERPESDDEDEVSAGHPAQELAEREELEEEPAPESEEGSADEATPAIVASETPPPGRDTVAAARAEVRRAARAQIEEAFEEDTEVWGELHGVPEADGGALLIDDYVSRAAEDPVIGPQFATARRRLGLTVDQLAERTRIRPHVIEAIEIDDFSACGGDFYARGHLRTLARVLAVEGPPLLELYDERYADAPIDPRRVFEAELAGAGSIRATRGGPNWSVLVAAVMALILCWSVARLITGGPDQTPDHAVLSGSGGPHHSSGRVAAPVPVTLTAAGGGARVVIRDGTGKLVFSGDLSYGQKHTVRASPPVRVQSTDGSVRVTVGGQDRGSMGPAGRPATQSYIAPR
ncbi:MAG: helix-turn-helix domain-containing protein, partial [Nocardioides sp.]|nr:helix-turn-helix domain-containing protein [Nocardioides sp.]